MKQFMLVSITPLCPICPLHLHASKWFRMGFNIPTISKKIFCEMDDITSSHEYSFNININLRFIRNICYTRVICCLDLIEELVLFFNERKRNMYAQTTNHGRSKDLRSRPSSVKRCGLPQQDLSLGIEETSQDPLQSPKQI